MIVNRMTATVLAAATLSSAALAQSFSVSTPSPASVPFPATAGSFSVDVSMDSAGQNFAGNDFRFESLDGSGIFTLTAVQTLLSTDFVTVSPNPLASGTLLDPSNDLNLGWRESDGQGVPYNGPIARYTFSYPSSIALGAYRLQLIGTLGLPSPSFSDNDFNDILVPAPAAVTFNVVPEPATLCVLAMGILSLVGNRRR